MLTELLPPPPPSQNFKHNSILETTQKMHVKSKYILHNNHNILSSINLEYHFFILSYYDSDMCQAAPFLSESP